MINVNKKLKTYKTARGVLLAMSIFTFINILLILFNADMSFLVSAFFPQILVGVAMLIDESLVLVASIIALVIVGVYFLFFFLSKKNPLFILLAVIMFGIDILLMILMMAISELDASIISAYVMMFIFEGAIMAYLVMGYIASKRLKEISPNGINITEEEIMQINNYEYGNLDQPMEGQEALTKPVELDEQGLPVEGFEANEQGLPVEEVYENQTEQLREHDGKGMEYFKTYYKNHVITVRTRYGLVELVVDGFVYAEKKGFATAVFELEATLFNHTFKVKSKPGLFNQNVKFFIDGEEKQF